MHDLHTALKNDTLVSIQGNGFKLALVRHQGGKDVFWHSLHVAPTSFTTAGIQLTDVLGLAGFSRQPCSFLDCSECYSMAVDAGFDTQGFVGDLGRAFHALEQAEQNLNACGIFLPVKEGWGYFHGRASSQETFPAMDWAKGGGDGHGAPKSERMKDAEDDIFQFVFSWIDGGQGKGWVTHYRPKHPPLTQEIKSALHFLGLKQFAECPQFEFEACHWKFTRFEARGDSFFDRNTDLANKWFDAHYNHFSPGIENLLAAQMALLPYGMGILPAQAQTRHSSPLLPSTVNVIPTVQPNTAKRNPVPAVASTTPYLYDVAISFAGPQRDFARELALALRDSGVSVFFDEFYPEHLWGRDLSVVFDEIYRKQARYCVVFASAEYVSRVWTLHELRSARDRLLHEKGEQYILPIQVEPVELPGIQSTIGYQTLDGRSIADIAEIIARIVKPAPQTS